MKSLIFLSLVLTLKIMMMKIMIFYYLFNYSCCALSFATQYAMPLELGGQRETEVSYGEQSV